MEKIINKNKIGVLIVLVLLLAVTFIVAEIVEKNVTPPNYFAFDPQNATYDIEGTDIKLNNGKSQIAVTPGSLTKISTSYFGNEAVGDLDGDKRPDTAFLLTQETGGSGTFFYIVAVLNKEDSDRVTGAVFLGDRISPQSTEIKDSKLYVNYAERKEHEPMTAQPSIGVTKIFKISDGDELFEIR